MNKAKGNLVANFATVPNLISALISQATNLGVVAMSTSVSDISVDMLRHILQFYVREDTIKAASAEIVNQHHQLPFSQVHGSGQLSSSDAQRFRIRADSLLAAYYPRYYGYYEKAIGIYTHVSDQYSVYSTKAISCNPREALYVLDGILENNTILKIREHTTDTHGYTEIIFALCYLLGYYFMPRIKDLKDQQLYRVDRTVNYGVFTPLLNKTADLDIIEEQWDALCYYCDDVLAEPDNNAAERALRAVCLGKKNYIFFGSDHGGERGALLYGLIGTCRLNGLDPEAYLRHILSVLPEWPSNKVAELLPWNIDLANK